MQNLNIGIVGAGVAGLTAGAGLAKVGHRVQIFDQFDTPSPVGSGLMIQPVGQSVLDVMDCLAEAQAFGTKIHDMRGWVTKHRWPVLNVAYDPDNLTGESGLAIHRSALFKVLLDNALAAGVHLRSGHKVTGIDSLQNRKLNFEDGRESESFDLVIDAAGARSTISPMKAKPLAYGALWGTVNWIDTPSIPATRLTQHYHQAKYMAGILPLGKIPGSDKAKVAVFWSLKHDNLEDWQKAPIETWLDEVDQIWPEGAPFFKQITTHNQMASAFYSHGSLRNWYAPSLIHIGDAAHRASPQLGQGANMALLDAWALVMAIEHYDTLPKALRAAQKMRKQHVTLYQALSRFFTPMYQSDSRILPMIRDWVLAPPASIPPIRRQLSKVASGSLIKPLRDNVISLK